MLVYQIVLSFLITFSCLGIMGAVAYGFLKANNATGDRDNQQSAITMRVILMLAVWTAGAIALAANGFFVTPRDVRVPFIAFGGVPLLLGLMVVSWDTQIRRITDTLDPSVLIAVQLFRVEGGFFVLSYLLHLMPAVFALPAGIGDVLIGITAPWVAGRMRANARGAHGLAVLWNALGLLDLVTAVALGVMSSPGRFEKFAFDNPNVHISTFPYVLIPTVLVPMAVILHVLTLRRLASPQLVQVGA